MKKIILSVVACCFLCFSGNGQINPRTIVANPINLNYRFQYDNPGYREAADPVCEYFKGKYYLFASKSSGYWSSPNLADWTFIPCTSIAELDNYAPTILVIDDWMYFAAAFSKIYRTNNPDTDNWERINTKYSIPNDPAFFRDDDGRVYIYGGCSDKDPIMGVEVDPTDGFKQIGAVKTLIVHNSDRYGWELQGDNNNGGVGWNEGPCINKYKGKYYLQYASPGTQFRTYADGMYMSDNPLGPYAYMEYSPYSIKPGGFIGGAGHGHTFQDKYGNYWHVASMKISQRNMFERRLGLFPVYFDEDDEICARTERGDYPFSIPDGEADFQANDPTLPWNLLSYNKTATASSYHNAYLPKRANDEAIETWWSAATGNTNEWWQVDLGESMQVNAIQVNFADQDFTIRAPHNLFAYQYSIEMSADGEKWTALVDKTDNTKDAVHDLNVLDVPVKTRYLRINNAKELPGKFSLYDFRVFGNGNGNVPDEVTGIQARRKTDQRRFLVRWNAQENVTGYIVRWGIRQDKLNHSTVVSANQLEAGYFNAGVPYYFSVDAFNENGITRGKTAIEGEIFFGESYNGILHEIPGTIEAEDFNDGEQDFAYYDTTQGNTFGVYRDTDVDINYVSRRTGECFLTNTATGEYLNYTIRAPETGLYDFDCISAAVNTSGAFYLSFNGERIEQPLATSIPVGNSRNFQTVTLSNVLFNQGDQVMTFHPVNNIYVDKFVIRKSGTAIQLPKNPAVSVYPNPSQGTFHIQTPQEGFYSFHNLTGACIRSEKLIQTSCNLDISDEPAGVYLLTLRTNNEVYRIKLIKE